MAICAPENFVSLLEFFLGDGRGAPACGEQHIEYPSISASQMVRSVPMLFTFDATGVVAHVANANYSETAHRSQLFLWLHQHDSGL
jgi:hypothetical protein